MPVVAIWCVILAGLAWSGAGVASSQQKNSAQLEADGHYELAVAASSEGDFALAAMHLEQFCSHSPEQLESPDSYKRRWHALFHLSELYVHADHAKKALSSLRDALWLECSARQVDLLDAGSSFGNVLPGDPKRAGQSFIAEFDGQTYPYLERWALLAEHAAKKLDNTTSAIEALADYRVAVNKADSLALDELPRWREHRERIEYEYGRRLEATGRMAAAITCYRELVARASLAHSSQPDRGLEAIQLWQRAYLRCCLKLAVNARDRSQRLTALEALQQLSEEAWLGEEHLRGVTFAQVDQLAALGKITEALNVLDECFAMALREHSYVFDESAHDEVADESAQQSRVDFLGNIGLRRSELLAASGRKLEALQVIHAAIEQYPDYQLVAELHYVAGRILVSRAEFDEARQHLHASLDSPRATSEQRGRAQWMIGETHFLQRNHAAAIEAYLDVSSHATETNWHSLAMMQTAKCFELQGRPVNALTAYQSFVDHCKDRREFAEDVDFARGRIVELTRTGKSSRAQTSNRQTAPRTR